MAKLYFRYGTVSSAKTLNLLAVAHNYRSQGKRILITKPALDTRFGDRMIASRAGLHAEADMLIHDGIVPEPAMLAVAGGACILVDEVQFLPPSVIDVFRVVATEHNVPVICYGLRTDFRARLFAGAQRLFELADSIEEIKTTCFHCNKKAIFNERVENGVRVTDGAAPQFLLGADDTYRPVCAAHYAS